MSSRFADHWIPVWPSPILSSKAPEADPAEVGAGGEVDCSWFVRNTTSPQRPNLTAPTPSNVLLRWHYIPKQRRRVRRATTENFIPMVFVLRAFWVSVTTRYRGAVERSANKLIISTPSQPSRLAKAMQRLTVGSSISAFAVDGFNRTNIAVFPDPHRRLSR